MAKVLSSWCACEVDRLRDIFGSLWDLSMSQRHSSSLAACVWIPLFPLRCEEARQDSLAAHPTALLAPDTTKKLWQVSPLARHAGVKPGMTVSQAIGLCPTLQLVEPDPVHYDEQFAALLAALGEVSPVIEPGELGLAYVGVDGLEGIFGSIAKIIDAIMRRTPHAARLGWGVGKFTAWVAASRAKPSEAIVVVAGTERNFLASQPIAVFPPDSGVYPRLRQLAIRTLGALAALPEAAITAQFGATGRRLWQLAAGRAPGRGEGGGAAARQPPPAQRTAGPHKHPRRMGWRVPARGGRAELEGGGSWLTAHLLKEPTADAA